MITLHHVQYGRSFRVLWLLEEIGRDVIGPVNIVEHQIGTKEMAQSSLAQISPAVRIPAIEMDGVEMSESGAIVQHLCETFALDRIAETGPKPSQIVISFSQSETEFGIADPDVTQFFEAYRVEDGTCILEFF